MRLKRFKYKLSRGCKVYHCGPGYRGKIKGFKYKNSFVKRSIYYLFVWGIWAGVAISVLLVYLALTLPNIDDVMNQTRSPSIVILDRNNEKIMAINDLYGDTVQIEKLPKYVWQAVVATEDKRFFEHCGVDIRGLIRAVYNNIKANKTAQGGSTITQQLAKNVFLSRERSLKRKIQEVMITLWLENKLSKNHILSLYLNRISLVGGKYGISVASEAIFGKSVYDLNIAESAILAGMLKAPSKLNPIKNLDASLNRMKVVLKLMLEQGYISQVEYEDALNYKYEKKEGTSNQVRYFTDYVMDNFNSLVGGINSDMVVYTTLDNKIQKTTENVVKSYVAEDGKKYNFSQVAVLVLNNQGEILSMLGGSDYAQSQFNRVTQMKRQPGSIFKPFVYLAGLEYGLKPDDKFEDKITEIAGWAPKNHDDKYLGVVSMAVALEKSLNTVPVQIAKIIGLSNIIKTAHKLGLVDKLSNDYSIILGTSETTLLDLVSAYATFANKGYGVIPHSIKKITTSTGDVVYERSGSGVGKLISEENVDVMNSMLRNVVSGGTGSNANVAGEMVFGKTGTSQNNRDAWFIGYTPKYITGVWIGNDDNSSMSNSSYGGTIPAKIFKTLMTYVIVR